MINNIVLSNFKSILNWTIDFSNLTVLTGLNASGKSSVIQALRIIDAAYDENKKIGNIELSEHVRPQFLKSKLSKDDYYQIDANTGVAEFSLRVKTASDSYNAGIVDTTASFPRIYYLSADRLGPTNTMSLPPSGEPFIGEKGQFVVDFLDKNKYSKINNKLLYREDASNLLMENVNGWLGKIAPNVSFNYEIEPLRSSAYPYYDGIVPTETGFGLSFTLPVITLLLYSFDNTENLFLIENPEAHLHPAAQTAMGILLAKAAEVGKQIVVETHSDHIIDGIRIAAKKKFINANNVRFHYFFKMDFEHETTIQSPKLLQDGKLSFWPKGFFDQSVIDKMELLKNE